MHEYKFPQQTFYYVDYDNACIKTETGFILDDNAVIVEREGGRLGYRGRSYLHLTEKAAAKELVKVAKSQVKHFKDSIANTKSVAKKQNNYDNACIEQWTRSIKLWEGLVPTKKKKPK